MTRSQLVLGLALISCCGLSSGSHPSAAGQGAVQEPQLKLIKTVPLGGNGRWDYLYVDAEARRLYVPRSFHMQVVDLDKGVVAGDVLKVSKKNAHGVALAPEQKLGFVSTGSDNSVLAFDLSSLKVIATIKTVPTPTPLFMIPLASTFFR